MQFGTQGDTLHQQTSHKGNGDSSACHHRIDLINVKNDKKLNSVETSHMTEA